MAEPQVSTFHLEKKSPFHKFTLTINGLGTMNNTMPPNAIEDNQAQVIYNMCPLSPQLKQKVSGLTLVASVSLPIIKFVNDYWNGAVRMFVILNDGSCGTIDSTGAYTQVGGAGTFSTIADEIDTAIWQSQYLLIVDANKGYFSFDGTTLTSIDSTITGTAILIWQGRVFIANNRVLQYSAALKYNDFATADGGGEFTISLSDLKEKIVKIVPYMDSLYIIGDHSILAYTGTTISSDPTKWYQMELFNTLGSEYNQNVINFNNTIYLLNEYGIWAIASTQSQKEDYLFDMSKVQVKNKRADFIMMNNLTFYLLPVYITSEVDYKARNVLLAYCIDTKEFFYFDWGIDITGVWATRTTSNHEIYVYSGTDIYKIDDNSTQEVTVVLRTKQFDFGFPFIWKTIRYLLFNIIILSSVPSFSLKVTTITQTGRTATNGTDMANQNIYVNNAVIAENPSYSDAIVFTNSYNTAIVLSSVLNLTQAISNIFYFNQSGLAFFFDIRETSNSKWQLINIYLEGVIGRALR